MHLKDYYKTLGVQPGASFEQIKKAYRQLARKHHPDVAGTGTISERFREIQDAYDILSDESKRSEYDRQHRLLHAADLSGYNKAGKATYSSFNQKDTEQKLKNESLNATRLAELSKKLAERIKDQAGESSFINETRANSSDSIVGKIKNSLVGKLKEIVKDSSEITPKDSTVKRKPKETERTYQFTISALESLYETTRELAIGNPNEPRMIRVKIPAGVRNNALLKVNCPATNTYPAVTVEIKVRVEPDTFVERRDADVLLRVPITPYEAITGAEIEIPSFNGPKRFKIATPWKSDNLTRYKTEGVKDPNTGVAGDFLVNTYIVIPTGKSDLSIQAAEVFEEQFDGPVRNKLPKSFDKINSD